MGMNIATDSCYFVGSTPIKPQINNNEQKAEVTNPQQKVFKRETFDLNLQPNAILGKTQVKQLTFAEKAMLGMGEFISNEDMDIIKSKKYQVNVINSGNEVGNSKQSVQEFIKDKNFTGIRISYTNKDGNQVKETMIYDKNAGENHAYYVETEVSPEGSYGKAKSDIGGGKASEEEYKKYVTTTLDAIQNEQGKMYKIETWE